MYVHLAVLHLTSPISHLHTFCPAPSESCAASRRSLLDRIAQYSRRLDSARLSAKSGRKTKCCGVFSFWHVIRYSGFFIFSDRGSTPLDQDQVGLGNCLWGRQKGGGRLWAGIGSTVGALMGLFLGLSFFFDWGTDDGDEM